MLKKIRKKIEAMIPGSVLNIAQTKRAMQKKLQAEGCSRTHAMGIVAERFRDKPHI